MDSLKERGKHLEDMFFHDQDKRLSELIKREKEDRDQVLELMSLSGITKRSVLDNAIKLGINANTFSALSLIPLLKVAWADHLCDIKESKVILRFAEENGIKKDSAAFKLLENWLAKEINPNLFIAWKNYVLSLQETLTRVELLEFKEEIIDRATEVAKASGGFLGIGSICEEENHVLHELEILFHKED